MRIAPPLFQPALSRGPIRGRISPPQRQLLRFTSIIRIMESEPKVKTPLYDGALQCEIAYFAIAAQGDPVNRFAASPQ